MIHKFVRDNSKTNKTVMRNFLGLYFIVALVFISFSSCDDDEGSGIPPVGEGLIESIIASPGDDVTFKGTFTTEDHFTRIALFNEELLLNKEIVFANKVSKYFLDYTINISEETAFGIYEVKILVESTGGASQEFIVLVNVASTPEASGLSSNISAAPGDIITFTGTITDAQGVSSIDLQNSGIELDETIELTDNPKEYNLNFSYTIPAAAEQLVHKGQFVITNISGRSVTYNMEVNLSGEDVTYTEMWAVGGFQWWTWNAEHAYMMLPDANDQNWFEIVVHAWPEDNYNQIKFIGQLDWLPDNWGLVDNTNPDGGMLNDEGSQPILLDAGSSSFYPAYFKVRFNPYDMQFTSEEIDQTGFAGQETMYIVGAGFPDYPDLDWNPEAAIPMERNPYGFGDHIYLIESLSFSDDVSLKFIGQNDGWSPVDVGFDTDYISDIDEETGGLQVQAPVSWVPTKSGDGTADLKFVGQAGAYTVLYDHFAKRAIVWMEE